MNSRTGGCFGSLTKAARSVFLDHLGEGCDQQDLRARRRGYDDNHASLYFEAKRIKGNKRRRRDGRPAEGNAHFTKWAAS